MLTASRALRISLLIIIPCLSRAQATDTAMTLNDCLRYAINNQPALKQSYIDEKIARANNRINLSGWFPQVGLNANYQHYFQLPTSFIPNTQNPGGPKVPVKTGLYNTLLPQFGATQTVFSNDVLFAVNAAPLYIQGAKQNTELTRIDLVTNVSKAFYDVLLTQAQIQVLAEDTERLGKNLRDAYSQYVAGIVDKVDYKRASISLNNSVAQLKNTSENVQVKYAVLKQQMGYPPEKNITVAYDTVRMMQEIGLDTTESLNYEKRVEYSALQNSIQIQHLTTNYYATSFIPSLSAFYNYIPEFENDQFSDLFSKAYPYSLFGVTLSLPIFQGFKRAENIRKSKLQEQRLSWDMVDLKQGINTEYQQAKANYKNNLNDFRTMQENVRTAREVYDVIRLQYREGIKQYLEVITAEADLRTSEINYLNALYQLLQAKIDLQKAMGDISTNI
jgi:outer membrane protein TolC